MLSQAFQCGKEVGEWWGQGTFMSESQIRIFRITGCHIITLSPGIYIHTYMYLCIYIVGGREEKVEDDYFHTFI